MSDASGRRDIREEDSLGADGLQGFPEETGTERSEVEDRGFKSHPRRLTSYSESWERHAASDVPFKKNCPDRLFPVLCVML
jgi:hypothetical protein